MRLFFRAFPHTAALLLTVLGSVMLSLAMHSIPTRQTIDIGGFDSAYVQGFFDQQPIPPEFTVPGTGRWSGADAALRLPLIGMPAQLTLQLRPPVPRTLTLLTADMDPAAGTPQSVEPVWQELTLAVPGVLTKFTDTPVVLRSETAPWVKGDLRAVGVLVDTLTYETSWGALPYPSTVIASMVTTLLLAFAALGRRGSPLRRDWIAAACAPHLLVAVAWRWPLTSALVVPSAHWWGVVLSAVVAAALHWQWVSTIWLRLQNLVGVGLIALWYAWYTFLQRQHVTLVVPGVEKDFRSFATRADSLATVLRADGFYQLGYPWLLWVGQVLSGLRVFDVATALSVLAGLVTVCAVWWLARVLYGQGWDVVVVAVVVSSAFFGNAAVLVGSDMPFTAATTLTLAVLTWAAQRAEDPKRWWAVGCALGAAFLLRHTGLVLVVPIAVALWLAPLSRQARMRAMSIVVLGWLVVALPQLWVNIRDTGNPFYNLQAKNSWLAVAGGMDWGRWADVPDDIPLTTVILRDPGRFVASWWHNITQVLGTGATDRQYDQAVWQRLLSVPFNWLSLIGVVWAGAQLLRRRLDPQRMVLYSWVIAFVAVSAVAFILPRLLLPLVVVAAVAATDGLRQVLRHLPARSLILLPVVIGIVLVQTAQLNVQQLRDGQPADERAALALMQTLAPQRLGVFVPAESPAGKYSVLSAVTVLRHTAYPVARTVICDAQADYLLWSNELVPPDPALRHVAHIGRYWIFRMADTPDFCAAD